MLKHNFSKATLLRSHFSMSVCSPVNLLHIFRTTFPKNSSGRLLLVVGSLYRHVDTA